MSLQSFARRVGIDPAFLEQKYDPRRRIYRPEKIERFYVAVNALYWQAVRSQKLGISWRNFHVGCCAYAYRPDVLSFGDHWKVFYGMNAKVGQNERNTCAEPAALASALAWGCTEIIGMVIVGMTQPDEKGVTPLTLRPCVHCRVLMKNHPLVKPHTLIVTAHPPSRRSIEDIREVTHEVHTFKQLLKLYGEA